MALCVNFPSMYIFTDAARKHSGRPESAEMDAGSRLMTYTCGPLPRVHRHVTLLQLDRYNQAAGGSRAGSAAMSGYNGGIKSMAWYFDITSIAN